MKPLPISITQYEDLYYCYVLLNLDELEQFDVDGYIQAVMTVPNLGLSEEEMVHYLKTYLNKL